MDNLIDRYLGFYADMIGSSVSILSEDVKQNKKFNDVIYDYLNEIVLGNDYVDNKELVNAVGFKASDSKLAFFKLLIDYGIVSRLELKDIGVYRTFMFIVDATMFFISLYSYVNNESVGEYSLDKLSKKIFKEMEFDEGDYLKEQFNKFIEDVEVVFYKFIKLEKVILDITFDSNFKLNTEKFNDSLELVSINYYNEELSSYRGREIEFIRRDYDLDIYKIGLTVLGVKLIKDNLKGKKRKVFIFVPDEVVKKKNSLKSLIAITKIYGFKRNLILTINYSMIKESLEVVNSLISEGYVVAIKKDSEIPNNFDLGNAKYLLLNYYNDDEFNRVYRKCSDEIEFVITNHINKENKDHCIEIGIKYFLKK